MLELLRHLYYADSQPDGATGTGTAIVALAQPGGGSGGQVPVADSRFRKAIEDYSMRVIMDLYCDTKMWVVKDVSRYSSWDIELISKIEPISKDDVAEVVHVEVKGTASAGASVFLTRNEVVAAREFSRTILAIVHGIKVVSDAEKNLTCSGGMIKIHDPWVPADEHLTVKQYSYDVPPGGTTQPTT
ncbi:protein NO VEIN domain-containing protein [Mycolicibacterium sediminis]|uniref:Protein NO VEIN C-terminal domain-containing protein n=1 Tax=Mycolicibacterium sediminis TaxID=1286180 RepID=A0A7I7QP11_9MYCO|nr:DUF3883 domain-containing protein [Mycolicibacterium sediminis]BBY28128.1 hypothetical protein MSEDJ_22240 [Mycolicibacterium sediminis]